MAACPNYMVSFRDSSDAVFLLEHLLESCFGPTGLTILLESFDGYTSFIHSGFQLTKSLTYARPVGHILVQAVEQLYRATGDGSKKLILMLATFLHQLVPHIGDCWTAVACRQALTEMSSKLTDTIIPSLAASQTLCCSLDATQSGESIQTMCSHLVETCIGDKCSLSVKNKLVQVVSTLTFPPHYCFTFHELRKRIRSVQQNFDEIVTYVPNTPPTESRVLPGFIIERSFFVPPPSLPLEKFGVIFLLSGLDFEEEVGKTLYNVNSVAHLSSIMHGTSNFKETLARSLASKGIRLILSSKKFDPVSAHFMRQHSVALIQMVPEETLCYMAEMCGTHPHSSAQELVSMDPGTIIFGKLCHYETAGRNRFINLICEQLPGAGGTCHAALLCGTSQGECRRMSTLVRRVVQVLSCWSQEIVTAAGDRLVLALRGGGAWELGVARELERHSPRANISRSSMEWIVLKALQKAFLAVPLTLLRNSHSSADMKTLHVLLGNDALRRDMPLGVDSEQGCLKCLDDPNCVLASVWEPYGSQITLIHYVCDLAKRILNVDTIVKTPHAISALTSEDDSSDEDT